MKASRKQFPSRFGSRPGFAEQERAEKLVGTSTSTSIGGGSSSSSCCCCSSSSSSSGDNHSNKTNDWL